MQPQRDISTTTSAVRGAASLDRAPAPTFAEYIPTVSAAVTDATRRVYDIYWNHILHQWGNRGLDEPTPSEIKQFVEHVRTRVVIRRNARGGRGAAEHFIAAFRRLYRNAEPKSTRSLPPQATILRSMRCYCAYTPKPPADAAAP